MDRSIIESTQELERETSATFARKAFYNYIRAWIVCINKLYGSGDAGINAFVHKFGFITAFRRLQRGAAVSKEFNNAYSRGLLTFKAMDSLPVSKNPELALSANFWLPVQSYYAIRGLGLATMIILNMDCPRSHSAFRAAFSHLVNTYFPSPFCGRCKGGPEAKDFSFEKLDTSIDKAIQQKHYHDPDSVDDIIAYIGKTLATTRSEFLESKYCDKRDHDKRRRLSLKEKKECCDKEHNTSICDLLYRMRLRSNYDNPDMYLFTSDAESAARHYEDFKYLSKTLIAGLEALIERRIGPTEMANLKSRLKSTL